MYYEPGQYPDKIGYGIEHISAVGFDTNPGAGLSSPNHVLNDHTYCCQMANDECEDGEPKVADKDRCESWHAKIFDKRHQDAARLGVPFILSEFGACLTEAPCTQEIS